MNFFWRRKRGQLKEELQSHLRMSAQDRIARGEDAAQAKQSARRELGNATLIHETTRDVWGFRWLETFLQDLRYALRMLRKSPGFTTVAVLTLALGIGANTAIFSIVDAVLLHPLPYKDPGRLVWLTEAMPSVGVSDNNVSWLDMQDWKQQNGVFEGIAGYNNVGFILTGLGSAQILGAQCVSEGYFSVIGVPPLLGRTFSPEENRPGGPPVVVISHSFWREHFAGDPTAIGKTLVLNDKVWTIVGVMPAGFGGVTRTRV